MIDFIIEVGLNFDMKITIYKDLSVVNKDLIKDNKDLVKISKDQVVKYHSKVDLLK